MNTLTNMLHGALGALILLVLVIPGVQFTLRQLGRLRGATRRLARRTLGLEHFEELTLDEVRNLRRDLEFYTRGLPSDVQYSTLRRDFNMLRDALQARGTKVVRLQREVEELGLLLRQYTDALGPMWTTAQGHQMPLRLLSTSHLRNIKAGNFGSLSLREFVDRELERRAIDAQWREREARGLPAPTRQDVIERGVGVLDPRVPFAYSPEVAARVARSLPQWAQDLIGDLVKPNPRSVTREEQRRVKRLPLWAQQLVADLRRPR